jgi:hypothetical protein
VRCLVATVAISETLCSGGSRVDEEPDVAVYVEIQVKVAVHAYLELDLLALTEDGFEVVEGA